MCNLWRHLRRVPAMAWWSTEPLYHRPQLRNINCPLWWNKSLMKVSPPPPRPHGAGGSWPGRWGATWSPPPSPRSCSAAAASCLSRYACIWWTGRSEQIFFRIVIKYFPGHYWHRRAHPQLQQRPLHRQGGGAEGELWLVEAGHVTSILTSDWSRRRRLTTSATWRGPRWRFHFRRWRGGCLSTFWDTRWQNTQHEIFHQNKTIARSPTWSTCSDARAGAETPSTLWPASRSGTETRDSCNYVLISTNICGYLQISTVYLRIDYLIFNIFQISPPTSSPPPRFTVLRNARCAVQPNYLQVVILQTKCIDHL